MDYNRYWRFVMRKLQFVLVLAAALSTQAIFAVDADMAAPSASEPCAAISKACQSAGFNRTEKADKNFWLDCMRPLVLGKTVAGVTVDADTIKHCRADKIQELTAELKQLQDVT
jgi:hypothetical protein